MGENNKNVSFVKEIEPVMVNNSGTMERTIEQPEFIMGRNFEGKKGMIECDFMGQEKIVVCLYFASSFSHPCKAFTPKLIEFYNEVNTEEKLLEIILVPFDKNEEDCKKYYRTMPWISLPYDLERIESYRSHYGVKGVPQLVTLRKDGSVLIFDACKEVLKKGEDAFLDWINQINQESVKQ